MNLKSDSHLPQKIICFNESPLKTIKNAFYFILTFSHRILFKNFENWQVLSMYWYISIFKLQKLDPFYLKFRAEFNGFIARAQKQQKQAPKNVKTTIGMKNVRRTFFGV